MEARAVVRAEVVVMRRSGGERRRARARRRLLPASAAVVAAAWLAAGCVLGGPTAAGATTPGASTPRTVHISITSKGFEPQGQEVAVGTTVVWTNRTSSVRDVTATDGTFYSGDIQPGFTFTFVFTQPGDYSFRESHTGAQGVVTVGPPSPGSASTTTTTTAPAPPPGGPPPGEIAFTGAGDVWLAVGGALLAMLGIAAVMASGDAPAPALAPFRALRFPRIRQRYLSDLLPWRLSSRARRRPTRGWTARSTEGGTGGPAARRRGPGAP